MNRSRAARMRRAAGRLELPKIECDRKATLGGRPKRRTSADAITAMSHSACASGSSLTKVSVMNSVCSSSVSAFIAARVCTPGLQPMTRRTWSRWASKRPTRPQTMASASPRLSISAAMSVFDRRTAALATSGVTPSRAIRPR